MISTKKASFKIGVAFMQGSANSSNPGITIGTEEIDLNGLSLKPGQISPRTHRFFNDHEAKIDDENGAVKLIGGNIPATDIKKFLDERHAELKIIRDKLDSIIQTSSTWKVSKKDGAVWLSASATEKDSVIEKLNSLAIKHEVRQIQKSDDYCIFVKRDAMANFAMQDTQANLTISLR